VTFSEKFSLFIGLTSLIVVGYRRGMTGCCKPQPEVFISPNAQPLLHNRVSVHACVFFEVYNVGGEQSLSSCF